MSETTTQAAPLLNGAAADPAAAAAAIGTTGATAPDPREWLPEAYRADPTFKDLSTVEALARSYKHAAGMVGLDKGKVLRLPAAPDAPEWGDVFAALGRPETPDKYELPKLAAPLIEGVEPAARAAFHQLGLNGQQAAGVMQLYGEQVQAAEAARLAAADQVEAAVVADLQREWGAAFQDRVHAANRAITEIGGAELAKVMQATMPDGTRIGSHPALIKAFAKMGERLAEPNGLKGGGTGQGNRALTPDEAQAEIALLTADATFFREFQDRMHPNRPAHKAKWDALHASAYPAQE